MKTIPLNGVWRMTGGGYDVDATVPGSVVSALLENGLIPDPYYGANEELVQHIFDHAYIFSRTFALSPEDLRHDRVFLRCDGLDTLCRIWINDTEIASTDNMHCQYRFDIRSALREGENSIRLEFLSPVEHMKTLTSPMGPGFASMRKAQCMFGWDWGIRLPDSGIWRDICIELADGGWIKNVEIRQEHREGEVALRLNAEVEAYSQNLRLQFTVASPEGIPLYKGETAAGETTQTAVITDPRLWWPAGYGEQPLYTVTASLRRGDGTLDSKSLLIGLRTVSLLRGESNQGDYQFVVNGTPIYIKGANIVIEDAIISRSVRGRWERLVRDAVESHYNTLRVWGGAYYPPNLFYELCDRAGLLVYQDFMFACRFYWPDDGFLASVGEEVRQQAVRLRNHPCLALWCGNNEADFIYTALVSDEPETAAIREMFGKPKLEPDAQKQVQWLYGETFLKLIPSIVQTLSPDVPYVHSSPSVEDRLGAESLFDYFAHGDAHYYHHVNNDAPYQKLGQFHIRFLSEFGFQSYPTLKTLRDYLPARALSPRSKEMLVHQKSPGGNETIELYLSRDFFVPEKFPAYVYMSQMMAGEILRYTAEHMRRDRAYSRGLLLWQHNDCWPVVSWSGVDYCGRWKGQQYYAKRFFAPVLASACLRENRVEVTAVNDRPETVRGRLRWTLYQGRDALRSGEAAVILPPGGTEVCASVELPEKGLRNRCVLCYDFRQGDDILSRGSTLLVEQKDFAFERPCIRLRLEECGGGYRLELTSDCYVKGLCLDLAEGDARFSDNFFDLEPRVPYVVHIRETDLSTDRLKRLLRTISVNDVACDRENAEPAAIPM